jgi:hypothetical protein
MIEDFDDDSLEDLHGNPSRVKPLFNPYQKQHEKVVSTSELTL